MGCIGLNGCICPRVQVSQHPHGRFVFSLTAWNAWSCSGPYKNAISFARMLFLFLVSSRKGALIAANWLEDIDRLLTKPRKLFRFLVLSGVSMGSMAATFMLSGLAPSGVQGGRGNSLYHTLTVASP